MFLGFCQACLETWSISTTSVCAEASARARAAGSHGPGDWKQRPCRIPALTPGSCSRRLPSQPNLWHNIPGRRTAVCSAASTLCSRLRPPGRPASVFSSSSCLVFFPYPTFVASFVLSLALFYFAASRLQFFPGGLTEAEVARSQGRGVEAKRLPEEVSHLAAA